MAVVVDIERQLDIAFGEEESRLMELPWIITFSTPMITQAIRDADPGLFADIEARVASGEPWTTRRMRRRSEYLWRLIDRGTVKPTPRGWFAHVGLVRMEENRGGMAQFSVVGGVASHRIANLHRSRRVIAAGGLEQAHPETTVAFTPIYWIEDEWFEAWVVMPGSEFDVTKVTLRRTPLLEAICQALRLGAQSLGAIEADVIANAGDTTERTLIRGFLSYLAGISILDVYAPLHMELNRWNDTTSKSAVMGESEHTAISLRTTARFEGPRAGDESYLDAYRQVVSTGVGSLSQEIEMLAAQAMRLLRAMADDAISTPPRTAIITEEPRPVLELLKQRIDADEAPPARQLRGPWPIPAKAGSPYSRLIEMVRANHSSPTFDLSGDILDELGAPAHHWEWPVDVLVRLLLPRSLDDPAAAIDTLYPAGALDARFADALCDLHGSVDHLEWYRQFLHEVERRTGYLFVEVLVPPLSKRAANAIRRPRFTSAWTGDTDLAAYCGRVEGARYIPLTDIWLRRAGDQIIATANGQPIWPVHHTTRNAVPPWDSLVGLLLSASYRPLQYVSSANLQRPIDAIPDCSHLPRIVIEKRLVISCEQWRINRNDLWQVRDTTLTKTRTVDALRQRLNLPRFIYLIEPGDMPGVCCDLESLRGIRAIDRILESSSTTLVFTEALPTPNEFPVMDYSVAQPAHLAAELMLRLPLRHPPGVMADRVAQAIRDRDGRRELFRKHRGWIPRDAMTVPVKASR